ncbi:hypothetical protein H6783_01815 [Candidatus Nomurabacteria bacterium]|nr:hypothetical protein [Candidatus Nomurabacteria bacterium]
MRGEKDPERIEALRERLYSRSVPPRKRKEEPLTDEPVPVNKEWKTPPNSDIRQRHPEPEKAETVPDIVPREETPAPTATVAHSTPSTSDQALSSMTSRKKRQSYRVKVLLAAVFFFVVAVGLSSLFILFGGNAISGENITLSLNGPFTIGGGEIIPLQVGITNQNSVAIEGATLIIDYPKGTMSATETGKELFVERMSLESIGSGETVNIPVRAQVFGEENEELTVKASIEYRVRGSNATFYKEAEPLRFKVSSSPIVVTIDSVKEISSGQEFEMKLNVRSNSPTTLSDILVKAEYPNGFDFTSSSPQPSSGRNAWLIEELEPEESSTITIRGLVVGKDSDQRVINFSIGVPNERDRSTLASIFAISSAEFTIEQPFIDVALDVDGDTGSAVAIEPGKRSQVSINVENTLSDAVYDVQVTAKLSGNALSGAEILASNGYYNSNAQTITWDVSNIRNLEQLDPGGEQRFSFSITPSSNVPATPQVVVDVTVNARRVSESNASEALIGAVTSAIRVESSPSLVSATTFNTGSFSDVGPIPPEVGRTTSYTIALRLTNGTNDITGGVMTAELPSYVTWLDNTAGRGTFSFNESTRTLTWETGSMQGGESMSGSFQVSILPSTSQIGTTPTLVGEQRFKADDRFTGSLIRTTSAGITTKMSEEFGFDKGNGLVKASGN